MKRLALYGFFLLFVLAGLFLSCGNPVYTKNAGGDDDDDGGAGAGGPSLVSISITRFPSKTAYEWGEELDISGLEVAGTYSDGSVRIEDVSRDNIRGYNRAMEGIQTLTVSIQGKTAVFEVIVWNFIKIKLTDNTFSSIEVVLPPGSTGPTSLMDWDIRIQSINGGPVSLMVYPGIDGCNFSINGTLSGVYEIMVIFQRKYSERIRIQV
jgi:hypothetical protein